MTINLSALQKQRRDTAANWTAENPTLLAGEIGLESDTGYWKVGDGATAWTSLAYVSGLGAEIPVDRLADGAARQLLQTDAAGTGVEWTDNVDVPGTLDVTGTGTFDGNVTIAGDLTVNGTTTTINTQDLLVEDKNVVIGNVTTPSDVTADGGGITLKGATDKTINWVDATDAWTLSEHVNIASGKEYRIDGTKALDATSLGSAVVSSSLTSVGTIGTGVWQGTAIDAAYLDSTVVTTGDTGTVTSTMIADGTIVDADVNASAAIAGTKISPDFGSQNVTTTGTSTAASFIPTSSTVPTNGVYLPAANSVALSTNGTGRLFVDASGNVSIGAALDQALNVQRAAANAYARFTDNTVNAYVGVNTANGLFDAAYVASNHPVRFITNNTERLRITSAGLVGIGTSSPATTNGGLDIASGGIGLIVGADGNATTRTNATQKNCRIAVPHYTNSEEPVVLLNASSGNGFNSVIVGGGTSSCNAATDVLFYTAGNATTVTGSERARIDSSGRLLVGTSTSQGSYNLQCFGTGVWGQGAYVNGSDVNIKQNIQDLEPALDVIKAMRPVTFQYKEAYSSDQTVQPGFIAQELQEAMAGKAYVDGVVQQGTNHLNVAYSSIIAVLVKAVQELEAKVAALESA